MKTSFPDELYSFLFIRTAKNTPQTLNALAPYGGSAENEFNGGIRDVDSPVQAAAADQHSDAVFPDVKGIEFGSLKR